jgi:hypothetical protein
MAAELLFDFNRAPILDFAPLARSSDHSQQSQDGGAMKSVVGSAPRRRESSVEEASTRRVVD